ncbi:hypothetical protein [Streptomyces sp. NPDC050504]|uniref:hypothetical protein n=1 Tax=Streptomyces sp. NPDC050504 TaxID=3365618 RepID=UPI0037B0990D
MSTGDDHGRYPEDGGIGGTGQTRTRLPEGPASADGYGSGARRGARPSRSMITVVGVVVLLVAAIAFANRGGGSDDEGGAPGGGGKPGASSTAASGVKPVEGKTGDIASGFARDEQGAQSAAANFAVALGSDGMFNRDRRREIANTVYAPDVAAARQGALDKVYSDPKFLTSIGLKEDGTAPTGLTFISRTIPVGTKVTKFENSAATVSVWYSSLFGLAGQGSQNPVAEGWYTNTFELKWVGGDWKVTDFAQKDGPAPVGRDQAASSADEMAEAVQQFGGFTYAR